MAIRFTYKDAGVDVDAKARFGSKTLQSTLRAVSTAVIHVENGFAGLYALYPDEGKEPLFKKYRDPVLVASADGVGTKLMIAFMMNKHDTVGQDLVAMSVNDMLVFGAEPFFFMDYISTGKLEPEQLEGVIKGIQVGCKQARCDLLGGETAEMPGMYSKGERALQLADPGKHTLDKIGWARTRG